MHDRPEMLLPESIRSIACRSGCEWGWRPEAIPQVIDTAEKAGLLNIGGQLQFRLPEATCECYWVEVDAVAHEPPGLHWTDRVARAATVARRQFADIGNRYDFLAEGVTHSPQSFRPMRPVAATSAIACGSSGTSKPTAPNRSTPDHAYMA